MSMCVPGLVRAFNRQEELAELELAPQLPNGKVRSREATPGHPKPARAKRPAGREGVWSQCSLRSSMTPISSTSGGSISASKAGTSDVAGSAPSPLAAVVGDADLGPCARSAACAAKTLPEPVTGTTCVCARSSTPLASNSSLSNHSAVLSTSSSKQCPMESGNFTAASRSCCVG